MQMPTGVVMRRTAELVPYANNARTHTPEQVMQIASSMREFGFTNPVLISGENDIIAGHGLPPADDPDPSRSERRGCFCAARAGGSMTA